MYCILCVGNGRRVVEKRPRKMTFQSVRLTLYSGASPLAPSVVSGFRVVIECNERFRFYKIFRSGDENWLRLD